MKFGCIGAKEIERLVRKNYSKTKRRAARIPFQDADLYRGKAHPDEYGCVESSRPGAENVYA